MILSHIEAGILNLEDINQAVKNMLVLAQTTARNGLYEDDKEGWVDDDQIRKVLRKAAAASVVLLKNDKDALPLARGGRSVKSIAVIGPNADVAHTSGGGAAAVPLQLFASTPLQGIIGYANQKGITVEYAPGTFTHRYLPPIARYLKHPEPRTDLSSRYCAKVEFWISPPTDQWQESVPLDVIEKRPDHVLDAATATCLMTDGMPSEIIKFGRYVRVSVFRNSFTSTGFYQLDLKCSIPPTLSPPTTVIGSLGWLTWITPSSLSTAKL
jgi:beta-glucosidase